ncbi:MAG TPA: glycosyltransferase [Cryomorphaceae bacterium]|nr:glycosyltransferase [Cryomorphaceae bacterium]
MSTSAKDPLIIECAWEVCNQVGGIYTVIRSKVPAAVARRGENYCLLGPLESDNISAEFDPISNLSDPIGRTVEKMRNMGYEVWYGTWLVTGRPKVVLLNPQNVFNRLETLHRQLKVDYGITTNTGDALLEKMVLWADLNRTFFTILSQEVLKGKREVVAHFHEWMSALPILDIAKHNLAISTVFTTHATMLGRYLAGNDMDFYKNLSKYNWELESKRYGILAQVQIERQCAHAANTFTTVSDVTGMECVHLLGKKPDVITPNGLNITKYVAYHEVHNRHEKYKEKIHEFIIGHFFNSYDFELDDTIYFFTSGRYEFRNKGFDVTLKALKLLNQMMVQEGVNKTVVMFFITKRPTWSINPEVLESRGVMQEIKRNCESIEKQLGERLFHAAASSKDEHKLPDLNDLIDDYWKLRYRRTIQSWKTKQWPIIVTHNLVDDIDDELLNYLRNEQMVNSPLDRVKMVYHPDFIDSTNPLFGMDYGQFVRGCHLGIFPSYYEPWGYTPLECVARGVPTVTSDLSGFGKYVENMDVDHEDKGVHVMQRGKETEKKSVENLAKYLLHFVKSNRRYRMFQRNKLEDFSEDFDWKVLMSAYDEAYSHAIKSISKKKLVRNTKA